MVGRRCIPAPYLRDRHPRGPDRCRTTSRVARVGARVLSARCWCVVGAVLMRLLLLSALLVFVGCASGPGSVGPGATQAGGGTVIPVGEGPTMLAIAPDGSRVYAASSRGLSVIDTATNTVV